MTPPFLAALGLAAGFLGFTAWDQSHWWRAKADYSFGWLVPCFVAFVVHDRWSLIRAGLGACSAEDSPRAAGLSRWVLRLAAAGLLAGGTGMFLLGAFYRAGAGTSQPGTLAITLGTCGILLPLLLLNTPDSPRPRPAGLFADARVRLVGLFLFPVLVWLISAPMVSAVENQLNLALLRRVVAVVAFVFDSLGLPIEQQGNVLVLPPVDGRPNHVGVEDACSGIRSLTACLFAGSFLGAVFLDRLGRKIVLVGAAMVLAFLTNLGRSLFLTAWAYRHGHTAIEGTVHDVAGYAVLGVTVAGLLGLVPLLRLRLDTNEAETPDSGRT
ncbi:MAG: exosortase/archaeosortase family protein [Verrucomicrobia bacterium]|nr:exosortase/archaeosortase family protein [Verrucomicrobiota bacterium]